MIQPKPDYSQLSIAERIVLGEDLWDSIVAESPDTIELSESQRQEIWRRVAAHEIDAGSAIPWEQLRSELFRPSH